MGGAGGGIGDQNRVASGLVPPRVLDFLPADTLPHKISAWDEVAGTPRSSQVPRSQVEQQSCNAPNAGTGRGFIVVGVT